MAKKTEYYGHKGERTETIEDAPVVQDEPTQAKESPKPSSKRSPAKKKTAGR